MLNLGLALLHIFRQRDQEKASHFCQQSSMFVLILLHSKKEQTFYVSAFSFLFIFNNKLVTLSNKGAYHNNSNTITEKLLNIVTIKNMRNFKVKALENEDVPVAMAVYNTRESSVFGYRIGNIVTTFEGVTSSIFELLYLMK